MKIKHFLCIGLLALSMCHTSQSNQEKNNIVRAIYAPIVLARFVAQQENYHATRSFLVTCKNHLSRILAVLRAAVDERAVL